MPTFEFEKIVRDKIPELIESQGGTVELDDITSSKRYKFLTSEKIIEELDELRKADTDEKRLGEIADAIDVLYGAAEHLGYTGTDIDKIRAAKAQERGAFITAPYVISITVPEDNSWVPYLRAEPDKYPETK
ncbi:hypothetical protein BH10PAT3_BH10PAT3_8160 [soil metagenome]